MDTLLTSLYQPSIIRTNICSFKGNNMKENSEARKRLINPDLYEPIERYGEQSHEEKIGIVIFE